MRRIPLALLEVFVEVSRQCSFTRAAEALNVTVSALSHRMRQLEDTVGERLFVRGPRGVSLTVAGRRLYDAVHAPLSEIDQALRQFDRRSDATLTLSFVPLMTSGWLVPRLPDLVAQHPQLSLNLHSSAALVDFQRMPIDGAMRLGRGRWPGLHCEWLFEEWVRPVASPALVKGRRRVTAAGLAELPLLGDPAGLWDAWFARFGGQPPARYLAQFDSLGGLHQAAVEGLGVALGRETLAQPLIDAGHLVALTNRRMEAGYDHYLVYPPRSARHEGFLAFRRWLYGQLDREVPPIAEPNP